MLPERPILARILRAFGPAGHTLSAGLCALSPRDLQSLLMALFEERSTQRRLTDLRADFARQPLLQPGPIDPRVANAIARVLFDAATDFAAVELSPVLPFAATHLLGQAHQNNVLTATRASELVADPTTALALHAAQRRHDPAQRQKSLHLCALHRCTRMQPTPPGLLPHFRLFALVSVDRKGEGWAGLRQHLSVHLQALHTLAGQGFHFPSLRVDISDTGLIEERLAQAGVDRDQIRREVRTQVFADPDAFLQSRGLAPLRGPLSAVVDSTTGWPQAAQRRLQQIDDEVLQPLSDAFPDADVRWDLSRVEGLGYYRGPCVRITAEDATGLRLPLVDGGYTDWMARLLQDPNERMLSTGMGPDLAALRFRRDATTPG